MLLAHAARAQDARGVYISGAVGLASQEGPIPSDDARTIAPTIRFSVGRRINQRFSVEASVELPAAIDFAYVETYAGKGSYKSTHRDTLLTVAFRLHPACQGRLCAEPLAGLGLTIERTARAVASCGSTTQPQPCGTFQSLPDNLRSALFL